MARITETAAGKGGVFAGAALLWLVLDRATKAYCEGAYALGQTSAHDWLIVRFRLIHNTGAAWGAFGDSTVLLGAFSLAVCIAIACAFAFYGRVSGHEANLAETVGLALVFAGGIGNAIDRFAQGFVTDFLDFTFMDFPVFNVADIGVTCGFVLLIIGYLAAVRAQGTFESDRGGDA